MAWKRYAGVVGEDVFTVFSFESDETLNIHGPRLEAGMSSNPIFVEIPDDIEVSPGWVYNGTDFSLPVE
jgi:hypothetical protein